MTFIHDDQVNKTFPQDAPDDNIAIANQEPGCFLVQEMISSAQGME
jgi:hypothetical protein